VLTTAVPGPGGGGAWLACRKVGSTRFLGMCMQWRFLESNRVQPSWLAARKLKRVLCQKPAGSARIGETSLLYLG
jgi:hypothetical protein